MRALLWLGIALVVLWAVAWLAFRIAGAMIHLLLVAGLVLAIIALIRRGARAI